MQKLKNSYTFETTFAVYTVDEIIGEGGAGRVFGGYGPDNAPVAVKVLAENRTSTDKRRRFKNEVVFLSRNKHPNIVSVIDNGLARDQDISGPFYVMPRFGGSLRDAIRDGLSGERVLVAFSQILEGVEAAHLQKVVHRDLKPENILWNRDENRFAIADFGIARFHEDLLATAVQTGDGQRLANFQYAAPEQRSPGASATEQSDIYALGLVLNEMFTGTVPHGTHYRKISEIDEQFAFLDPLVEKMLTQNPGARPGSIAEIKGLIQRYRCEAISLQRISQLDGSVIKMDEIDEPLALSPPRLVDADWDRGQLKLTLDRPVTSAWINALRNMGSYRSVLHIEPSRFSFDGKYAYVPAAEHQVQDVIDHFKTWLPNATATLKSMLDAQARREEAQRRDEIRRAREKEEIRLRVLRNIRI